VNGDYSVSNLMCFLQLRISTLDEAERLKLKKVEEDILKAHTLQSTYEELSELKDDFDNDDNDMEQGEEEQPVLKNRDQAPADSAQADEKGLPAKSASYKAGAIVPEGSNRDLHRAGSTGFKGVQKRGRRHSFDENEFRKKNPSRFKLLAYLMKSLDSIVSEPFVYFAKRADPISMHNAVQYICDNELSDNIYIVHFVDDRKILNERRSIRRQSIADVKAGDSDDIDRRFNDLYLHMFMSKGGDEFDTNFTADRALEVIPLEAHQLVDTVAILGCFFT
jgi:hypothetical protein